MSISEWEYLQNVLCESLKREVALSREILSNMRQEELSLLLNDEGSLADTLYKRSGLLQTLSDLRYVRIETVRQISQLPEGKMDITSIEIASLSDQLGVLTCSMARQQESGRHRQLPVDPYLHVPRPKKKAQVATLQVKQ
jgi:hypothetical protein